ncbi:MAG: polysulfide reductase NrfD [Campylobacterales bacterium]|nr:polysulfide reductase NrfD [Campylobacterales bacterium]
MIFESLVANVPVLKSAIVTLDVLFTQIAWGWIIVMNMWAKSIATGVFFVGVYMMRKYPTSETFYKYLIPLIGLVFVGITLLFTVLDLHKPFRAFYIFLHSHFTSAITWGAWFINLYSLVLVLWLWAVIKKDEKLFSKLTVPGLVIAFVTTVYTAGLMGLSNAREIWQAPTEIVQMLLAAGLAGSAILLIAGKINLDDEQKLKLGTILGFSALMSFVIYVSEVIFAPTKSEEGEWTVHYLTHGGTGVYFALGLLLAFVLPATLAYAANRTKKSVFLLPAAVLALVGLWMVKHVWLIAPQMMPLS